MLYLTRKPGESVVIHDDVYCTVMGYQNGQVLLGFDAPKSIPIHRDEIQRRIDSVRIRENWLVGETTHKESIVDRLINKFKSAVA